MTPKERFAELVRLYTEMQFRNMIVKAEQLVTDYPFSFEAWNILAAGHKANGQLTDAENSFRKATEINPVFAEGYYNLGITLHDQGKLDQAILAYKRACEINPCYMLAYFNMGNTLKDQNKLDEATTAYKRAIDLNPAYAEAHNNIGNVLREQQKFSQAIIYYQRAIKTKADYTEAYYNLGITHEVQGKLDEAVEAYGHALKINPAHTGSLKNTASSWKHTGKLNEALAIYERVLQLTPNDADIHNNMGNIFVEQGKYQKAVSAYQRAIDIKPEQVDAYNGMGVALHKHSRIDEALAAYQRALQIKPDHAEVLNNMGNALTDQGKLDEAIESYQKALDIKRDYADAYNGMGVALHKHSRIDEALAAYQRALQIKPDNAYAYNNLGTTLWEHGKLDEAIASYQKALDIKPDYASAQTQMLHQLQHICDFERTAALSDCSATLGIVTTAVTPFAALTWADNSKQQLARSRNWAREEYTQATIQLPARPQSRPARLKVGYFSADFHDHATMFLMAGLLRNHDRTKFELFAYSYGRNKSGRWRKRAEGDVDHFFDVTDLSDHAITDLVLTHCLDIAVDLKGYTTDSRSGLFQYRLAPIQINYLGFPGSMGVDFIDYIVADPVVIPRDQRPFYSEKAIYLPNSYQPNDDMREIAQTITTRADFGLPEDAFVFCCFNNSYKISPREFTIWMRVLDEVEGSVLWLFKANKWAEQNLRKEAEKRGINPLRLIFADRVSHSEHLARHKHADLFIDTFNYNAHTTASDALWAGLPVVTKQGSQFAARVAASLLTAVGLQELITTTEEAYKTLILELATNREKLAAVKNTLAANRLTQPLFDTKRYARDFEAGLAAAYDLYFSDQEPQDILVSPAYSR